MTSPAARNLRTAALAGDAQAQYELGLAYDPSVGASCYGLEGDYQTAFGWLLKAAAQGHLKAMSLVAMTYRFGLNGVARDDAKAIEWCLKLARRGDVHALVMLGQIAWANDQAETAAQWLVLAARRGDAYARSFLRTLEKRGIGSALLDPGERERLLRRAAWKGDLLACIELAGLFEKEGTPKGRLRALAFYLLAAWEEDVKARPGAGSRGAKRLARRLARAERDRAERLASRVQRWGGREE